jgi:hypothetical protein
MKPTIKDTINSAIIAAFTIAAALIWKDVIVDLIETLVPPNEKLFFKFLSAVVATIFVVAAIYFIVKAESEAEYIIDKAEHMRDRMKNGKKNDIPTK